MDGRVPIKKTPALGAFFWGEKKNFAYTKKRISSWAERTRKNMESGYTVAYPTAGASVAVCAFEYARAGGLVVEPDRTPIIV